MAYTNKAWNGSASRYASTNSYCSACLLDDNPPGKDKVQSLCKLPIAEPNGDINTNALSAALSVLSGARGGLKDVSAADKKKAARTILRHYRAARMDVPDSLKNLAQ